VSQLIALWAASAAGIVLFLATGYYWARARQQEIIDSHLEHLQGELLRERESEAAYARHTRDLDQRFNESLAAVRALEEALLIEREHRVSLESEVSQWAAEVDRLTALELESADSRASSAALETELSRAKSINASLTKELQRLRQDQKRLSAAPARAPASLPAAASSSAVSSAAAVRRQSGMTMRVRDDDLTLEGNLQRQLAQLSVREPDVTAVLADAQGFALAGVGPRTVQNGISAVTCLARDLALRASELAELEPVEMLELVDAKGRALRVRFFASNDQLLSFGSLGQRDLASSEEEERMVSTFPEILFTAESA
jgi:hypothetical protein